MATATLTSLPLSPLGYSLRPSEISISVEEYLRSAYHPDMDYVDGHLEERNMGEIEHSELQRALLVALDRHALEWGIRVLPECRLQVTPERFRVPDIMLVGRNEQLRKIVRVAPLLCVEILSPEDNHKRIVARIDDYVRMGVKDVWVLDPEDGRVFTHANNERRWIADRVLQVEGTAIRVDLDEIAAYLAQ